MPHPDLCPACGAPRPPDAPAGLCPPCLLERAMAGSSAATAGAVSAPEAGPGVFVPPPIPELAALLPQLEIIELLGQGGMGAVYKARQPHLDRPVALKILPPAAGADPAFAGRFAREARVLARLNHPGIVSVHDFGRSGDYYYLIMEYVDGLDLRRLIRGASLSAAEALKIVPQICDALQYAHEEGVVHRDIKPENVLVDRRGRVKVADFGLAKLLDPGEGSLRLTGSRQVMGTWRYMAPEQIDDPLAVDHRADIYSLGVVFYELLTGELPVGRFALPSQKAEVDARLDDVVLKALENEPERRYQHVSEVRSEIDSIAEKPAPWPEDPGADLPEPPGPPPPVPPYSGLQELIGAALAGDREAIRRLVHPVAWILGAASTVLFFAWIFEVIPGNPGLFLWITAGMLAWSIESAITEQSSGKVQAAMAIRDPKARDAALPQVLLEAASQGEGSLVLLSLSAIRDRALRDQTAGLAALELAKAGESEYALYVARTIADRAERDDLLQRLARGG